MPGSYGFGKIAEARSAIFSPFTGFVRANHAAADFSADKVLL
jgi:hypothetical protein